MYKVLQNTGALFECILSSIFDKLVNTGTANNEKRTINVWDSCTCGDTALRVKVLFLQGIVRWCTSKSNYWRKLFWYMAGILPALVRENSSCTYTQPLGRIRKHSICGEIRFRASNFIWAKFADCTSRFRTSLFRTDVHNFYGGNYFRNITENAIKL